LRLRCAQPNVETGPIAQRQTGHGEPKSAPAALSNLYGDAPSKKPMIGRGGGKWPRISVCDKADRTHRRYRSLF